MNLSLKTKMALAVSLLFILFSLAMTWFTVSFFQNKFEVALTGQQSVLTGSIAQSIDNKLGMARTAMSGASAKVIPAILVDPERAQEYLDSRPTLQAIFDNGLYFFGTDGRLIAQSSYISPHPPHEIKYLEQLCATTAATSKPHISSYTLPSGEQAAFVSVPVLDGTGRLYAIMAGGIDLQGKNFVEEISRMRIGRTGYLYICDADGNLIVHQNRSENPPLPAGAQALLKKGISSTEGSGITIDPRYGAMITSYRRLSTAEWVIVVNLPAAEAYAPLLEARKYFIGATIIGTAVILLLVWVLMKRLMEPLQAMIRHISRASDRPGEERFCTIDSQDEIGTLASAFNVMIATQNSQQKEVEEAAVRAENEKSRAEAIIAAIGEGLSIHDREFRVLYQNRIHREMFGDHRGQFCYEAYEKEETVCSDCPVARVFSDGKLHSVEKKIPLGGTPTDFELLASPLRDSTGEIVAAIEIARDITSRKRTEEEIRELNSHLQQKAAELELSNTEQKTFGYSLSHDLKTPLTRISLAAQTLAELYDDQLDETGLFCIETIKAGSERMDEMIEGMLLLSGISRSNLEIETVNLSETAEEIAGRLQAEEPERVVSWSIEPSVTVSGDARLLKSVLENLLGNAWKYTGKTAAPRIEFGRKAAGRETILFIRDNGAGFDSANGDAIFRPFHRLHGDGEFKGSGIGLATVQRIILKHGGKIWAEGIPEEGAVFYFTLPPAE